MLEASKPQFQKALDHLMQDLSGIRTGQATPAIVENIQVEVYGAQQPLKAVASISTPDSKTIQMEVWDTTAIKSVEKALIEAGLGMNPNVDGKKIRLNMPMMTDEQRQKMVRLVKDKVEEARISIRRIREEVKKEISKQEGIGEDDKHRQLDDLEKFVKKQNEEIDEMGQKKEMEIKTI